MKNTALAAGLTTALLATSFACAGPASAAPAQASHWVCHYGMVEGGLDTVMWKQVATATGTTPVVGALAHTEDGYQVVGSVTATPPTRSQCVNLLAAALEREANDPVKTVTAWSCLYQATEKGLVFMKPTSAGPEDIFAFRSNPVALNVTPTDAATIKVGEWNFGEGVLTFVIAKTARGASAPTKAACDASLAKVTPKVDAQFGTTFTQTAPTPAPTKSPGRGVPAKTGVEEESPVVPLGLGGVLLAGLAGVTARRRG